MHFFKLRLFLKVASTTNAREYVAQETRGAEIPPTTNARQYVTPETRDADPVTPSLLLVLEI
jgi:hypothetical protein